MIHLSKKRDDYIDWDEYFLVVSILSAQRSKDPNTQVCRSMASSISRRLLFDSLVSQVGACIVNEEKKIVGIGYNGFPKQCNDDALPWSRTSKSGSILDTKYPFGRLLELKQLKPSQVDTNHSSITKSVMRK